MCLSVWLVTRMSVGVAGESCVSWPGRSVSVVCQCGCQCRLTHYSPLWGCEGNVNCVVAMAGYIMCCCHCWLRHVLLPLLVTSCVVAVAGYVMCCCHCRLRRVLLPLLVTSCVVAVAGYVMCCCHCRLRHVLLPLQVMSCWEGGYGPAH